MSSLHLSPYERPGPTEHQTWHWTHKLRGCNAVTQQGGPAGEQAAVGLEGAQAGGALLTFLTPSPGSEHFLPSPSQALRLPRLPAGLPQNWTSPGLPAVPVTRQRGWHGGTPGARPCPPRG